MKLLHSLILSSTTFLFLGCGGGSSQENPTSSSSSSSSLSSSLLSSSSVSSSVVSSTLSSSSLSSSVLSSSSSSSIAYQTTPIVLGNPLKTNYPNDPFARNIWDMSVYDNKIYFGGGNSANEGPSPNAGAVPLMVFNGVDFSMEGSVDDEQIDIFTIDNTILYIAGHDATQSWDYANFYKKTPSTSWQKTRTIPNALHVLDLAFQNGKMYSALGSDSGAKIGTSSDGGASWSIQEIGDSRVYSFMQIQNTLFALKKFMNNDTTYQSVAKLNTTTGNFDFVPNPPNMFPNTTLNLMNESKIFRVTPYEDKALYIGAYKYNSYHPFPFGLYSASLNNDNLNITKINLNTGYIPRDILIQNGKIYLLVSVENSNDTTIKVLESSTTTINFTEILSFSYATFARSFALYNDDFYFGMGCDLADMENLEASSNYNLPDITGDIIKIAK